MRGKFIKDPTPYEFLLNITIRIHLITIIDDINIYQRSKLITILVNLDYKLSYSLYRNKIY